MRSVFAFVLVLLVLGCDVSIEKSHRSGTIYDDYKEDRVPKKYRRYSDSTNYFMEAYTTKQFSFIEYNYIAPEYRAKFGEEHLKEMSSHVERKVGHFRSYLTGQWGFVPEDREGVRLIHSVKIVEHERATMHYIVTFSLEGNELKIVGFSVKERKGVRAPGQL